MIVVQYQKHNQVCVLLVWYRSGTCAVRSADTTSFMLLLHSDVVLAQTASNMGLPYILSSFLKLHMVLIFHMASGRLSIC